MKACKIEECVRKYYSKGFCEAHYQRHRTGRKIDAPINIRGNDKERFMFFVNKTDTCWLWNGTQRGKGYGRYTLWDKNTQKQTGVSAHRYSYQLYKGVIPDGLQLDHLCMNKLCVNPNHLEPVTNKENQFRAMEIRGYWPIQGREKKKITCIVCGKDIMAIQYERRKYCSNSCSLKAKRARDKELLS